MNSADAPIGNDLRTAEMARLFLYVEGQTEESFVKEVLAPHLYSYGYTEVVPRPTGGIRPWPNAKRDILRILKQDAGRIVSTMVDFYGLPQSGSGSWPGRMNASKAQYPEKARTVEKDLLADVCLDMGKNFNPSRFIPYVMMHEFEAMLFSDCAAFSRGIERPTLANQFQAIRNAFASPEEIDDSPLTAPSKRVEMLVPGYTKPLLGALAVLEIGLEAIRRECPHFGCWLDRLEAVPTASSGQSSTDLR